MSTLTTVANLDPSEVEKCLLEFNHKESEDGPMVFTTNDLKLIVNNLKELRQKCRRIDSTLTKLESRVKEKEPEKNVSSETETKIE
ncbi:hypothetical protein M0802_001916 [Mischocyttarus mexicanus]|nr:hypothetical protein M0802_001916 [Mischocyttarus mexicanus]